MSVLRRVLQPVLEDVLIPVGGDLDTIASRYDGTNDFQLRGADLTGNADSKQLIFSVWAKFNGGDGVIQTFVRNAVSNLIITKGSINQIVVVANNVSSVQILRIESGASQVIIADGNYHHILCSVDLGTPSSARLFIDDVESSNITTFTDDTIDFTAGEHAIGATTGTGNKMNASLSELYVNFGESLALVLDNRRKFITGGGKPVDLGSDGRLPTGTSPIIYAPDGDASNNKGTGGDFTTTGALDRVPGP